MSDRTAFVLSLLLFWSPVIVGGVLAHGDKVGIGAGAGVGLVAFLLVAVVFWLQRIERALRKEEDERSA